MKMVHFRLSLERREVVVNPDKVLYACISATGCCTLHFSKECFIRVQGELDEVAAKLEGHSAAAHGATRLGDPAQPSLLDA